MNHQSNKNSRVSTIAKKRIVSLIALTILAVAFIWYVSNNWSSFQEISIVNPWLIVPAILFVLANIYCSGMLSEIAIEPHGIKLSRHEIFGLSALTRFSKQITPAYLSVAVRATYLKKNYSISFAKFSSSLILTNMLQFLISGLLAVFIYFHQINSLSGSLPVAFIILAIILFTLLLYAPTRIPISFLKRLYNRYNFKILERAYVVVEELKRIRAHPTTLLRTLLWEIATLVTSSIILIALYGVLGYEIGLLPAVFIAALSGWSMIFSITPSNLGIREGLMVLGAGLMNVSIPATLAVTILFRLITFLSVALLSAYYAPKLLHTTIGKVKDVKG